MSNQFIEKVLEATRMSLINNRTWNDKNYAEYIRLAVRLSRVQEKADEKFGVRSKRHAS